MSEDLMPPGMVRRWNVLGRLRPRLDAPHPGKCRSRRLDLPVCQVPALEPQRQPAVEPVQDHDLLPPERQGRFSQHEHPNGSRNGASQGTSLRLATRPWLIFTGKYGRKLTPGQSPGLRPPWMRKTLILDVPHRQVVFTIPKRLRVFFKYKRRLLGDLCRVADRIIYHLKLTFLRRKNSRRSGRGAA